MKYSYNSTIFMYSSVLLLTFTLTLCQVNGEFNIINRASTIFRVIRGGPLNFGDSGNEVAKKLRASTPNLSGDEQLWRKLCVGQGNNELLRYDQKSGQCYLIRSDAPCGANMKFYSKHGSKVYGECDCMENQDVPLVYHPRTNQCYFIYQQAYCRSGDWLSFNRQGKPFCGPNKCFKTTIKSQPWTANEIPQIVPFHGIGDCVQFDKPNAKCGRDEVIVFRPKQLYPSCGIATITTRYISPDGDIPCAPGSSRSLTGQCNADDVDWDF